MRNGGSVILSETTETYGAEHLFTRRAVSREVGEKLALDDVRSTTVTLTVDGSDGFRLAGSSPMTKISRDPEDLAAQTIGPHHQYPDGLVLFLGTMFAPVEDRDAPGQGFTHKVGDIVTIAAPKLGQLVNRMRLAPNCERWTFGTSALMRNSQRVA